MHQHLMLLIPSRVLWPLIYQDSMMIVVTIDASTLEDIIPESVAESTIGVLILNVTVDHHQVLEQ